MKKVFKKAALATLGLSLVAGSAQAVVLGVYNGPDSDVDSGPAYLANEANDGTVRAPEDFAPGLAVGTTIGRIMVTVGINSPTKIVLSMDNADFTAATVGSYFLYPWDDANNDGVVDGGELTNPVIGSTGNDVVGNLVAGELTFVGPFSYGGGGGLLPAGTRLILGDAVAAGPAVAPTGGVHWAIKANLTADSTITMTVTESGPFGSDTTDTAVAGQFMNEYVLCTDTTATNIFDGIIDLTTATPKTAFTVADGNGGTTANDDSLYSLIDRDAVATNGAGLNCGDSTSYINRFYLTQAANGGSVQDIYGLLTSSANDQALGNAGSMQVAVNATVAVPGVNVAYVAGTGWQTATTDVNADGGGTSTTMTWEATVDGNAIDTRTFDMQVVSVPAGGFTAITYELATGISDGAWTLGEGYDGIITYFPIGYAGYNAFIKITNRDNEAAEVTLNGICENTTDGVQVTPAPTGSIADVAAGEHVTVGASDVVTALGLDSSKGYQCAIEIVSSAPATLFQASGIQIGPDGRTALPLYNIAGSNLNQ